MNLEYKPQDFQVMDGYATHVQVWWVNWAFLATELTDKMPEETTVLFQASLHRAVKGLLHRID